MTGGGKRANSLPAIPLGGLPLLLCDWKCWFPFALLESCREDSWVPVQTCHCGVGFQLTPPFWLWNQDVEREGRRGRSQVCPAVFQTICVINSWLQKAENLVSYHISVVIHDHVLLSAARTVSKTTLFLMSFQLRAMWFEHIIICSPQERLCSSSDSSHWFQGAGASMEKGDFTYFHAPMII